MDKKKTPSGPNPGRQIKITDVEGLQEKLNLMVKDIEEVKHKIKMLEGHI